MKLRYFIDEKGNKIYTLKEKNPKNSEETKNAHYKFIKTKISIPISPAH